MDGLMKENYFWRWGWQVL